MLTQNLLYHTDWKKLWRKITLTESGEELPVSEAVTIVSLMESGAILHTEKHKH